MWVNLLKFAAVLFLNRKVSALKNNFVHLRHHVADYAEARAELLRLDFVEETERMAASVVGILMVFSMFIFTGLLSMLWLLSLLWEHPHRTLILGLVTLATAGIGAFILWSVYKVWKRKPLFSDSLQMISHDWRVFRNEMMAPPQESTSQGASGSDAEKPAESASTPT